MDTIIRNVRDIDQAHRSALEQVLGQELGENQQIVVRVVDVVPVSPPMSDQKATTPSSGSTAVLPDWCRVYEGLSDEEIEEIEKIALRRADLTRASE